MSTRTLVLCADDYALHPWVDDAVQQLARAGRLSATSCMSTAPRWREASAALQPLRPVLQVGLHFNLTDDHGGARPAQSLRSVIAQAYARRHDPAHWHRLWCQQLDAFEDAMGSAPDFIDGHQHVHQLPGVRHALQTELQRRYARQALPWVRSTAPASGQRRNAKALVIAALGGWSATRQWQRAGIRVNQGFAGVYGFDAPTAEYYRAHMRQWLAHSADGGLLMCHPAAQEVPGDAIGRQRPLEFAYLMSDAFGQDLQSGGWRVQQGAGGTPGCTNEFPAP